ncbi:Pentatricopeptide repeat [Dillenia turbinata]|uniref:Pentatricopeptide repeat n=1 Tax=Dillenia turbinata TaxID=194707 RepID=A0AAN8YZ60_9MAGN
MPKSSPQVPTTTELSSPNPSHWLALQAPFSALGDSSFLFLNLISFSSNRSSQVRLNLASLLTLIPPSNYTFSSVIKAYAGLVDLRLGRIVHSHVLVCGYGLDLYVHAALVSFYAKCGDLDMARKKFDVVPERGIRAWNAMISGYEQMGFAKKAIGFTRNKCLCLDGHVSGCGMHGCGVEAIDLFRQMTIRGTSPNHVTFVAVLSACAHAGLVCEGGHVFSIMREKV